MPPSVDFVALIPEKLALLETPRRWRYSPWKAPGCWQEPTQMSLSTDTSSQRFSSSVCTCSLREWLIFLGKLVFLGNQYRAEGEKEDILLIWHHQSSLAGKTTASLNALFGSKIRLFYFAAPEVHIPGSPTWWHLQQSRVHSQLTHISTVDIAWSRPKSGNIPPKNSQLTASAWIYRFFSPQCHVVQDRLQVQRISQIISQNNTKHSHLQGKKLFAVY